MEVPMHPNHITDPSFRQYFFGNMVRVPSGCLEWQGYRDELGYGTLRCDGKQRKAHRVAWIISNGQISEGLDCLHHCDNPACCEVEHLFLGTHADNNADMKAKGRAVYVSGERSGNAKLSADQVREIRALYQPGSSEFGQGALGRRFGVSRAQIAHIINRHAWAHI
jgi:hypothetical protein